MKYLAFLLITIIVPFSSAKILTCQGESQTYMYVIDMNLDLKKMHVGLCYNSSDCIREDVFNKEYYFYITDIVENNGVLSQIATITDDNLLIGITELKNMFEDQYMGKMAFFEEGTKNPTDFIVTCVLYDQE